jgi:hypothetical protein
MGSDVSPLIVLKKIQPATLLPFNTPNKKTQPTLNISLFYRFFALYSKLIGLS